MTGPAHSPGAGSDENMLKELMSHNNLFHTHAYKQIENIYTYKVPKIALQWKAQWEAKYRDRMKGLLLSPINTNGYNLDIKK